MNIDFSYIINLSYEYDYVCGKFAEIMKVQGQMPYYVFAAVNGKKLSMVEETTPFNWSIYQNWKLEKNYDTQINWERFITPGELGCGLSHYWLWKDAHVENRGITLHLEEDFIMNDWPTEKEFDSLPNDWDMVLLGRKKIRGYEDEVINDHILKPGYSKGLHAYILSPSGQRKLSQSNYLDYLLPVDEFIWGMLGKSPREDLNQLFHNEPFNLYAFTRRDFVAQQSSQMNSQTEFCCNVKDVREWDKWTSKYLNPNVKSNNFLDLASQISTQGGILEFPLFTKEFCDEVVDLIEYGRTVVRANSDSHLRFPLANLGLDRTYNKIVRDHIYPFLNWYWDTNIRGGIFANKNYAFKYALGSTDIQIINDPEHGSTYTLGLRLTNDEIQGNDEFVSPSQPGNVIVHPTLLTENYDGKKFVYDNSHCILSFF